MTTAFDVPACMSRTQMSVSLPLRAVLDQANQRPSAENRASPFCERLPSVSNVVSRVPKSNQYSCENSLPPTSRENTKPSSGEVAGAGVSPATGSA